MTWNYMDLTWDSAQHLGLKYSINKIVEFWVMLKVPKGVQVIYHYARYTLSSITQYEKVL